MTPETLAISRECSYLRTTGAGNFRLVDSPAAAPLLDALGPPETTLHYTEIELGAVGIEPPSGGAIEEAVYGGRGLSLIIAREAQGTTLVTRVRGFLAMPSPKYLDLYVSLWPEPIE